MQKILILAFLIGCGRGPDPVPPSAGAPLAIDAAAVVEPVIVDASLEPSPPTGLYTVSTDVNDGCARKKPTSSSYEGPVLVQVKHDRGKTWMNVPLISPGDGPQPRWDVGLEGKQRSYLRKWQACPNLNTITDVEIVKATHDTIRLVRTETVGDGSKCPQPPPESNCTRETVFIYTLKKSLCEAPCNAASTRFLPDGGIDVDCRCP